MARYIQFLLFLGLIAILPHRAAAQQDSLAKYFDDGGMSTRKNIISTNVLSPGVGELSFRYERAIGKRFSVEVGVHPKLPFVGLGDLFGSGYYSVVTSGGIGISGAIHYFFLPHSPELHFMGPRYRMSRGLDRNGNPLQEHGFQLTYGYNLFLNKFLIFSYIVGIGYAVGTIETPSYRATYGSLFSQFNLGIGVMF